MKKQFGLMLMGSVAFLSCTTTNPQQQLAETILNDTTLHQVDSMARSIISQGFNAGSGYSQIWARDMNTFIEVACEETNQTDIRNAILLFFALQQPNDEMIDGYVLKPDFTWYDNHPYYADAAPDHVGFKNTVETDQESSLIQIVGKYIRKTGDTSILREDVAGRTVLERMDDMVDYLMRERYSEQYGLLFGAMTADWGDVQPNDDFGCDMNELSSRAIDVYDNAMFLIALDYLQEMTDDASLLKKWKGIREQIAQNVRKYLWDAERKKFIPHLYIDPSPIPAGFDENQIHYHGGTAVAIEAGLLSKRLVIEGRNCRSQCPDARERPFVGYAKYRINSLSNVSGRLFPGRNVKTICLPERWRLDLVRRTYDPAAGCQWFCRSSLC